MLIISIISIIIISHYSNVGRLVANLVTFTGFVGGKLSHDSISGSFAGGHLQYLRSCLRVVIPGTFILRVVAAGIGRRHGAYTSYNIVFDITLISLTSRILFLDVNGSMSTLWIASIYIYIDTDLVGLIPEITNVAIYIFYLSCNSQHSELYASVRINIK